MADDDRGTYARNRVISRNLEIDALEERLRLALAARVSDIQELRERCPHDRVVEVWDKGRSESGNWERRDRFCLDCGDHEGRTDLSPGWDFERLKGEPLRVFHGEFFGRARLLKDRLHRECRLDVVPDILKGK